MGEISEEQSWAIARSKVEQLGSVPSSFSALLRRLRLDMQTPGQQLSPIGKYELERLLRGPSILSPLVYAAIEFHPEKISDVKNLSKAVTQAFSLEELCALIGILYLTRQVKKRISEQEWGFICEILVPYTTMAGHLGAYTSIGFERALSAVAFSVLGMALFQPSSPKEYATYRRVLKKNSCYFDRQEELNCFGSSSREMCSLLSQTITFSSAMASEFLAGPTAEPGKRPTTNIQALNVWISSLVKDQSAPKVAMDAKWYPTQQRVGIIESMAQKVKLGSSPTATWIIKSANDLESVKPLLAKLSKKSISEIFAEVDEENGEPFGE